MPFSRAEVTSPQPPKMHTYKNINHILYKVAGCTSELNDTEQSSWLMFLKYLYALEADKLTLLLKLRYNNGLTDAMADLEGPVQVRQAFVGMQKYLFEG